MLLNYNYSCSKDKIGENEYSILVQESTMVSGAICHNCSSFDKSDLSGLWRQEISRNLMRTSEDPGNTNQELSIIIIHDRQLVKA